MQLEKGREEEEMEDRKQEKECRAEGEDVEENLK